MSLRTKILLLFGALAVVPMVAIGVADYYQSLYALGAVIETKAQATSEARARTILDRHAQAELAVTELAAARPLRLLFRGPRPAPGAWRDAILGQLAAMDPSASGLFASFEVLDAGGRRIALVQDSAGRAAGDGGGCSAPLRSAAFERPVISADGWTVGRLRAVPRADGLFPAAIIGDRFGATGMDLVVDRRDGRIVYSDPCELVARSFPAVVHVDGARWRAVLVGGSATFRVRRDSIEYVVAAAPVPRADWLYLTMVPLREFTSPYAKARSLWLLLVVGVGAAAGLAFLVLSRRPLLALRRLSGAADAIGRGEFSLWLPPGGGDDEVGRLSQAFVRMTARLKDLMRQVEFGRQLRVVGQMGAYVAHEIRNPLGAISIHLESLAREVDRGRTPERTGTVLHLALDEIRRLEDIVNSFLALGQTQSGERTPTALHRVVEAALTVLRGELGRRGLHAEFAALAPENTVVADRAALQGALVNLLLNAADASPPGGTVRMWTEIASDLAGERVLRLHIADEGSGVAPEMREHIFEPFFTTKPRGNGIGLPVARQIVEEHGGRLYCESPAETAGGAEFVLELPLAAPAAAGRSFPGLERAAHGEELAGAGSSNANARKVM